MSRLTNPFSKKLSIAIVALGCALLVSVSEAATATMNDANSQATVDLDSDAGMYYWSVNGAGGINQLAQPGPIFVLRAGCLISWRADLPNPALPLPRCRLTLGNQSHPLPQSLASNWPASRSPAATIAIPRVTVPIPGGRRQSRRIA